MPTLEWIGDARGHLRLLDQTRLPTEVVFLDCRDVETVFEAIRNLRVRGAPAIGVAAAYGVCLAAQSAPRDAAAAALNAVNQGAARLAESRPTAVNLFWALERMRLAAQSHARDGSAQSLAEQLLAVAREIEAEDRRMCRAIGAAGQDLIAGKSGVITHCNAGGLATSDYGTALALIFAAQEAGHAPHVYVDETRPLLQGARLTAWELVQRGISATLICDSMAGQVMREGRVQAAIVGADRIAANGDTANKIGTYSLAVLAAAHDVPFYVAAPSSTFDLSLDCGAAIPIEQRAAEEITHWRGLPVAPAGVNVYNPAFDVTPARLITAIICERGVIQPVSAAAIRRMLHGGD